MRQLYRGKSKGQKWPLTIKRTVVLTEETKGSIFQSAKKGEKCKNL
jgi:hypothetical protein